jgi:citrate/tricarballylate utilization protein
MVAIFLPAFLAPGADRLSLRDYWREVAGRTLRLSHVLRASRMPPRLKNLSGGQGQGCNFEDGDRYSDRRRVYHQLMMYGFLLCFASTSSGTVMHYVFDWQAPYPFWSPPKLLGVPGGLMMVIGAAGWPG